MPLLFSCALFSPSIWFHLICFAISARLPGWPAGWLRAYLSGSTSIGSRARQLRAAARQADPKPADLIVGRLCWLSLSLFRLSRSLSPSLLVRLLLEPPPPPTSARLFLLCTKRDGKSGANYWPRRLWPASGATATRRTRKTLLVNGRRRLIVDWPPMVYLANPLNSGRPSETSPGAPNVILPTRVWPSS